MAENLTVARPYAQAAFEFAVERRALDRWEQMLCALAVAGQDPYMRDAVKVAPNAQAASEQLITVAGDLLDDAGRNFVRVVGENRRFDVLPEIYAEFKRLRDEHERRVTVQCVSARPLSRQDQTRLLAGLNAKYGTSVLLETRVEPDLIGGLVLRRGDEIIDASVKSELNRLRATLN